MGNYCAQTTRGVTVVDAQVGDRLTIRTLNEGGDQRWIIKKDDRNTVVCLDNQGKIAGAEVVFTNFERAKLPGSQAVFCMLPAIDHDRYTCDAFRFPDRQVVRLRDLSATVEIEVVGLRTSPEVLITHEVLTSRASDDEEFVRVRR